MILWRREYQALARTSVWKEPCDYGKIVPREKYKFLVVFSTWHEHKRIPVKNDGGVMGGQTRGARAALRRERRIVLDDRTQGSSPPKKEKTKERLLAVSYSFPRPFMSPSSIVGLLKQFRFSNERFIEKPNDH